MDVVIWISKSLYKMLIIFMLVELMNLPNDFWTDVIIMLGVITAMFSSIPYRK